MTDNLCESVKVNLCESVKVLLACLSGGVCAPGFAPFPFGICPD